MIRKLGFLVLGSALTACSGGQNTSADNAPYARLLASGGPSSTNALEDGEEPAWDGECEEHDSGSTCVYNDGQGSVCTVELDGNGELVYELCSGDWGSYECEADGGVIHCQFSDGIAQCTDVWSDDYELLQSTCGGYGDDDYERRDCNTDADCGDYGYCIEGFCEYEDDYYEDPNYEESCATDEAGVTTCTWDDGYCQGTYTYEEDGRAKSESVSCEDGYSASCTYVDSIQSCTYDNAGENGETCTTSYNYETGEVLEDSCGWYEQEREEGEYEDHDDCDHAPGEEDGASDDAYGEDGQEDPADPR